MFRIIKLNTSLKFFRPLSVFLVILVTRSCHSSNGDMGSNSFRDSGIMSTNLNFLDYDLCLTNYDVSEGSIIRTKDSQALGGRFINESDLGSKSREECLRLCCRTPHCNVISFEEKNSGSCYLFDCGPIENFRCKFTEQPHYMSAILRKRQNPPNNQHEAELSQLRNSEDNRLGLITGTGGGPVINQPNNINVSSQSSRIQMIANMTPVAAPSPPMSLDVVDNNSRHCSRREFECKSTRECIAIYNACDGIPQCSDGSDESSELHCPSVLDSSVKSKGIQGVSSSSHSDTEQLQQQQLIHQQQQQSQSTSGVDTSLVPSKSLSSSRIEDFRLAPSISVAAVTNAGRQQGSSSSSSSSIGSNNDKDKIGGNSNVNFEMSSRMNIFNHKDGGIMDDTYGNQLQQQRQNPIPYWKSYDYGIGETPNGYGQQIPQLQNSGAYGGSNNNYGNNGPPFSIPYQSNFQLGYQQQMSPYNNIDKTMNIPPLSQQQLQLQAQQQLPQYYYNTNTNNNNNNNVLGSSNGNQNLESPRLYLQSKTNVPDILVVTTTPGTKIATTTSDATTKATNKPASINSGIVDRKLDISSSKIKSTEAEREDQLIQSLLTKTSLGVPKQGVQTVVEAPESIPGAGAVLAFIIGLAMSIIMVIMIGCRLRRIKLGSKRRGKNRLDPDYLVDGMYL